MKLRVPLTLLWNSLLPSVTVRLMLSLKRAAIPSYSVWGAGHLGSEVYSQRAMGGTRCVGGSDFAMNNLSLEVKSGFPRSDDQDI